MVMIISREDVESGCVDYASDPDIDTTAPRLNPVHPGKILRDEFMIPLGLSSYRLGNDIDVPVNRISEMVNGRRGITADTALRFAQVFGTSAQFWMNLQTSYDLEIARHAKPWPTHGARPYARPPMSDRGKGFQEDSPAKDGRIPDAGKE